MASEPYRIESVGHVWERTDSGIVPRIVSAMVVHRHSPKPSGRMARAVWVLDYSLSSCGFYRTGSPSGPWHPRPANEAHLYPPRVAYWEKPGAERSVSSAFVTFVGGQLVGLDALTAGGKRCCRFHDPDCVIGRVIQEAAQAGGLGAERAFCRAQSLLFRMFDLMHGGRMIGDQYYRLGGRTGQARLGFCATAQEFLRIHLSERVTLGRVARALAVSQSTLTHKYAKEAGESPMQTLLRLRINRARTLLLSGERLKNIADQTGFVDASHLSRAFKRSVGLSPRAYVRTAGGSSGS